MASCSTTWTQKHDLPHMKTFWLFIFCALHWLSARLLWKCKYIKSRLSDNIELFIIVILCTCKFSKCTQYWYVILHVKNKAVLHLEVAIPKFLNKDYEKYRKLHSANSINVTKDDSANSRNAAENDQIDWQFSISRALFWVLKKHLMDIRLLSPSYLTCLDLW